MTCLLLGLAIIYVISPIDFLPEMLLGPIGLIDDAVVIMGALTVMMKGGLGNLFGFMK